MDNRETIADAVVDISSLGLMYEVENFAHNNPVILAALAITGVVIFLALHSHATVKSQSSWKRRRLDGKTVIVTGATDGIGRGVAQEVARRGARVIIPCRDVNKGQEVKKEIQHATKNYNIVVHLLDLSSLTSIRAFVQELTAYEGRVDILINCAGSLPTSSRVITEDGLEYQMCVKHFGPFLLSNLLHDLLKKSSPSRIINVACMGYIHVRINFDDINSKDLKIEEFDPWFHGQYQSALATIMFTREFGRRYKGSGVTANVVMPGPCDTALGRILKKRYPNVIPELPSTEEAVAYIVHCAVDKRIEHTTGEFFAECIRRDVAPHARDEDAAKRLWELSEQLVGLQNSDS